MADRKKKKMKRPVSASFGTSLAFGIRALARSVVPLRVTAQKLANIPDGLYDYHAGGQFPYVVVPCKKSTGPVVAKPKKNQEEKETTDEKTVALLGQPRASLSYDDNNYVISPTELNSLNLQEKEVTLVEIEEQNGNNHIKKSGEDDCYDLIEPAGLAYQNFVKTEEKLSHPPSEPVFKNEEEGRAEPLAYLPFFAVNRRNAEMMLMRPNIAAGTFLLRPLPANIVALSVRSKTKLGKPVIGHVQIVFQDESCYAVQGEVFACLDYLLGFYSEIPLSFSDKEKSPISLSTGYPRKFSCVEINQICVSRTEVDLFDKIGDGNFGEVFKGEWNGLEVAVKCLKPSTNSASSVILDEAKTMAAILHENLIKLIAVSVDEAPFMIIAEYMNLGSLLDCLQGNGQHAFLFSHRNLLDILQQILCGMAYLEAEKLLHRDLRAANCLVHQDSPDKPFDVKVADFGLAAGLDEENVYESHSNKCVPVRWTAPEALLYKKFSNKSDVWSFGVLAFEVFSLGHLPYSGKNNFELWRFIDSGGRIQLSDIHAIQQRPDYTARRCNEDKLLCPEDIYTNLMANCWLNEPSERPTFAYLVSFMMSVELEC